MKSISRILFAVILLITCLSTHAATTAASGSIVPKIDTLQEEFSQQVLNTAQKNEEESEKKNFISIEEYPYSVNDADRNTYFWNDSGLTFGHKTDFGTFLLGIEHRYRANSAPDINGTRYRVEAYPIINKKLSFHLAYAYSNASVYPLHDALASAHVYLPSYLELSAGAHYYDIYGKPLWAYTPGLSKYYGKHWFSFQPVLDITRYSFGLYYAGTYRYYIEEPNHYFALSGGGGKLIDLFDVTDTRLKLYKAWHVFSSYQFPLQKNVFTGLGAGFIKENYPSGLVRRKLMGLLSLKVFF